MSVDIPTRVAVLEDWRESKDRADEDREERLRQLESAKWRVGGSLTVLAVLGSSLGTFLLQLLLKRMGG